MPSRLSILLQTDDLIAIDKPASLATIPGRIETDSVIERLGREIGLPSAGESDPRLRVVHRLDKDTSGVLLFAKNRDAQRHLSHQFQNNTIEKQYLALVIGQPQLDEGDITAPLGRHPKDPKRMAILLHGGRPARTLWKVEERFRNFTLLRVFPKTGKTHQIRVHLASIGLPLAIDALYNGRSETAEKGLMLSSFKRDFRLARGVEERPLIARLTLHAERLEFTDPRGEKNQLIAPLPKDFRSALNMLGKYSKANRPSS